MLRSADRGWQASSLGALLRIDDSIGDNFPCSGKTGDERISTLKRMDKWIWKWHDGKLDFREDQLMRMKMGDWMSAGDIGRWESFFDYLKNRNDSRCPGRSPRVYYRRHS
jgi:hypothetical protein